MPTPHEQNQLRCGRGIAALQHYKGLLGEHGLADSDTLKDLLADFCHAFTPGAVLAALGGAYHHHHAEASATEDDPEGDAASARYLAIRHYAVMDSTDGVCERDEHALLSEGDDNGCYVSSWTWFPFHETAFDKEASPEQRMEYAIHSVLGDARFKQHCGLNADWSVCAWLIMQDVPGTAPNRGSGYYLLDEENGGASLVWRNSEDGRLIRIHEWPDAIAFCTETPESLKARCHLPEWHCLLCFAGFKEPGLHPEYEHIQYYVCPHCGTNKIMETKAIKPATP